jgi:hypothetical protein
MLGTLDLPEFYTPWSSLADNKGYNYDKNHHFWKNGLPENFENLLRLSPCPDYPGWDTLGVKKIDCFNWGGDNPDIPDASQLTWTLDDPTYKSNFNILKELARSVANKKIHFLIYITPESPYYRTTASYSVYGPGRTTSPAIIAQIKSLQDSFPSLVHFYDGNIDGYHDYVDSEACNFDHLCIAGAKKFSVRMDSVVHAILNR